MREWARIAVPLQYEVGNTIDPAEGFRKFRDRDPCAEALMRKRGFTN